MIHKPFLFSSNDILLEKFRLWFWTVPKATLDAGLQETEQESGGLV